MNGAAQAKDNSSEVASRRLNALGQPPRHSYKSERIRRQQDQTRLLGLQERVTSIGRLLELMAKALDGFAQEQEREHDWLIRPKRARDQDSGRDR